MLDSKPKLKVLTTTEVLAFIDTAVDGDKQAINGFKRTSIINFCNDRYLRDVDIETGSPTWQQLTKAGTDIYKDITGFKLSEQKARTSMQYTEYGVTSLVSLLAGANLCNALSQSDAIGGATATAAFSTAQIFIQQFVPRLVKIVCEPIVNETDLAAARLEAVQLYVDELKKLYYPERNPPAAITGLAVSATGSNIGHMGAANLTSASVTSHVDVSSNVV